MSNLYQADNDLLFIEDFHIHRARSNLVSFFRGLLLSFFGKVDSKLSVYIPDIEKFVDKSTNRTVYKFADVETSLVKIAKWWTEEKRGLPYVLIAPGPLIENKTELGGENLHFIEGDKNIYGSQADTDVTFLIGAQSDMNRTRLADLIYTSMTQFYRKNFLYKDFEGNGDYSLIVKNDSIKMSTDSAVDISDFEKIYTIGVQVKVLLDWQYSLDTNLFTSVHYDTEKATYNPEPELSEIEWTVVDVPSGLTDAQKADIHTIQSFLYLHLDEVDFRDPVVKRVTSQSEITDATEGDRFLNTTTNNILVSTGVTFTEITPEEGWVVKDLSVDKSLIFLQGSWILDTFDLI